MLAHAALILIEVPMLMAAIPLWMTLPGAAFAAWMTGCLAVVYGITQLLNDTKKDPLVRCFAGSDGWMMGQEADDERWVYVGGMGLSPRQLSGSTLPMLSKLFSRPMTGLQVPTCGLPFDLICLVLQRTLALPTPTTRLLYSQLRAALVDSTVPRVVVIAHNTGAISASQVVAQLCVDLPLEKVSKLEVYTFGSAAYEFVIPVGEPRADPQHQQTAGPSEPRKTIHTEHFALARDPFARFGVLKSVREHLVGRFCGGVFILNNPVTQVQTQTRASRRALRKMPSAPSGLSIHDYMRVLFPAQLTNSQATDAGALESIMMIDRDMAEKREFAAMSNYASIRSNKESKRLSWTGLGATAGQRNGVSDGVVGLELARRGCRDCEGHRGTEVTWLTRYVNIGAAPVFAERKETPMDAVPGQL
ncbi:hypothetical protein GQ53DRAFT_633793 [Thozetella sp. PMI_491]|nr:hypothetical protein GQ53DRAFT_633793 [Thozetella sp. PMI_491]